MDRSMMETVPLDVEERDIFPTTETASPVVNPKLRVFKGDGTEVLHIDACTAVNAVIVGRTQLPPFVDDLEVVKYGDGTFQNPDISKTVRYRLFKLDRDALGNYILRRGFKSNHGLWQDGENIFVDAEWMSQDQSTNPPATSEPEEVTSVPDPNLTGAAS